MLLLYIERIKINARDNVRNESAFALYALSVIFVDEFRKPLSVGFSRFIEESRDEELASLIADLTKAVKRDALDYYLSTTELSTISLAKLAIDKVLSSKS